MLLFPINFVNSLVKLSFVVTHSEGVSSYPAVSLSSLYSLQATPVTAERSAKFSVLLFTLLVFEVRKVSHYHTTRLFLLLVVAHL